MALAWSMASSTESTLAEVELVRKVCSCGIAFFWAPCVFPEDVGALCNSCFYAEYPELSPSNIMNHPNYEEFVKGFYNDVV